MNVYVSGSSLAGEGSSRFGLKKNSCIHITYTQTWEKANNVHELNLRNSTVPIFRGLNSTILFQILNMLGYLKKM